MKRHRQVFSGRAGPWVALLLAGWMPLPCAAQLARPSPAVADCVAANRQAHAELSQAQDGGLRRHALHPMVVTRLQGLGSQLVRLRDSTVRNPRNLAECEQTAQALAAAREQFERIVGTPALVAECMANNQQLQAEVQGALRLLQTAGKTPVATMEAAAGRLETVRVTLARQGPTLADCRQSALELAEERSQLARLSPATALAAAPPFSMPGAAPQPASAPSPAVCRETQARVYNTLAQDYARLVGGGPIAAEWMAPLQSLSERLTRLHAVIADSAAPGWDCDAVSRALAQARSDLSQLVRR